ncbi:hypothetical protein N0V83_009519 [Neocucurbitaria cava]|uniref:Uncharacterized protein n=1 Tax=Neocucurbitaria cava TaxID=798079 RepID=A0A9W8Y1J3_9PLEO|nr:hypothetical protein N0V83_009519 [Neocucurbitaria cava]
MANPSSQTWTLRLKSRKTTVLLHVDPLHTFATIKSYLYDALQETGLKNPQTGDSIPLPASPSDIQLGKPVNMHDPRQGFTLGEWEYPSVVPDEAEDGGGAGKGKAKAGRKSNSGATASAANVKDCPKGAGLKDGVVLAFRWVGDGLWEGMRRRIWMLMGMGMVREEEGERGDMWGVKLASYEDAYGVDVEADVGGGGRELED